MTINDENQAPLRSNSTPQFPLGLASASSRLVIQSSDRDIPSVSPSIPAPSVPPHEWSHQQLTSHNPHATPPRQQGLAPPAHEQSALRPGSPYPTTLGQPPVQSVAETLQRPGGGPGFIPTSSIAQTDTIPTTDGQMPPDRSYRHNVANLTDQLNNQDQAIQRGQMVLPTYRMGALQSTQGPEEALRGTQGSEGISRGTYGRTGMRGRPTRAEVYDPITQGNQPASERRIRYAHGWATNETFGENLSHWESSRTTRMSRAERLHGPATMYRRALSMFDDDRTRRREPATIHRRTPGVAEVPDDARASIPAHEELARQEAARRFVLAHREDSLRSNLLVPPAHSETRWERPLSSTMPRPPITEAVRTDPVQLSQNIMNRARQHPEAGGGAIDAYDFGQPRSRLTPSSFQDSGRRNAISGSDQDVAQTGLAQLRANSFVPRTIEDDSTTTTTTRENHPTGFDRPNPFMRARNFAIQRSENRSMNTGINTLSQIPNRWSAPRARDFGREGIGHSGRGYGRHTEETEALRQPYQTPYLGPPQIVSPNRAYRRRGHVLTTATNDATELTNVHPLGTYQSQQEHQRTLEDIVRRASPETVRIMQEQLRFAMRGRMREPNREPNPMPPIMTLRTTDGGLAFVPVMERVKEMINGRCLHEGDENRGMYQAFLNLVHRCWPYPGVSYQLLSFRIRKSQNSISDANE